MRAVSDASERQLSPFSVALRSLLSFRDPRLHVARIQQLLVSPMATHPSGHCLPLYELSNVWFPDVPLPEEHPSHRLFGDYSSHTGTFQRFHVRVIEDTSRSLCLQLSQTNSISFLALQSTAHGNAFRLLIPATARADSIDSIPFSWLCVDNDSVL
ncbi:hypothetical protein IE81DRAFT_30467 [Ceraceosorus guamensis]|uniref:Uncharacterized protein n=1 Tax=Ceraceosorus guamensis TaxID=1522189 RepID=A0A316W461_9BASI|nr:hypothetical protein IE81DRAFT_30467 [Ceraceosorus guamensis]PWN44334.1 hypothetical protein IE81DRAFT_30467 [Ceraceosorus guamensis]